MGYSPLFFYGNWGSSKDTDNKLPAGLDPAMERGPASNAGRILQMEMDHWEQSRPIYFIFPVTSFLLNFISQHNYWPRGSQPCSTPAQPSTDVTAKGNHIFRGNNISLLLTYYQRLFQVTVWDLSPSPAREVIFTWNLLNSAGQADSMGYRLLEPNC